MQKDVEFKDGNMRAIVTTIGLSYQVSLLKKDKLQPGDMEQHMALDEKDIVKTICLLGECYREILRRKDGQNNS
jgi:hypothetical protein